MRLFRKKLYLPAMRSKYFKLSQKDIGNFLQSFTKFPSHRVKNDKVMMKRSS